MTEHTWQECKPALLIPEGGDDPGPEIRWAMVAAWSSIDDDAKRMFHEYCCEFDHDVEHTEVMSAVAGLIQQKVSEFRAPAWPFQAG